MGIIFGKINFVMMLRGVGGGGLACDTNFFLFVYCFLFANYSSKKLL